MADKPTTPANADLRERLWRARRYMDECYDQPLDLERQIAARPQALEKAKELLRLRSICVTDVCFEVGFQSLGSFSTLFHKSVGAAPINYRRRQRESLNKIHGCFISMYGLKPSDR